VLRFAGRDGELSVNSPYVEIVFSLPAPDAEDPAFVLSVRSSVGFLI
jgi:hypothetical protein